MRFAHDIDSSRAHALACLGGGLSPAWYERETGEPVPDDRVLVKDAEALADANVHRHFLNVFDI